MPRLGCDWSVVHFAGCALALAAVAMPVEADIDPVSGIDFARIDSLGNAPWPGTVPPTPGDRAVGRGRVDYTYHIGRFEVTTSQWVEFYNAAFDRPQSEWLPHLIPPNFWGAAGATPNTPGGLRWRVPAGNEMLPVGNISWRMAAMYCNWLHNGKQTNRGAFLDGAYDVSTFTYTGTVFNDQQTHHPNARYWIPTWDEWLKSAHYDPDKSNPDGSSGGWWLYPNRSDTPLVYGPPGVLVNGHAAQANAEWSDGFPGFSPFGTPLGAYSNVRSAFGLFDLAGATTEWTEEVILVNGVFPAFRVFDGSTWALGGTATSDQIQYRGGDFPSLSTFDLGFRIASSIPGPAHGTLLLLIMLTSRRCGRERSQHEQVGCHLHRACCDRSLHV
ncbi:MAG: SUMF1/EgtB/PvdO family nonheme iron enzyme [Phycisphaerales bacterium]|nr:SUMF1/EgtB/PvdO family nonheme iron enzyme [Phycisphaerales bacterium]